MSEKEEIMNEESFEKRSSDRHVIVIAVAMLVLMGITIGFAQLSSMLSIRGKAGLPALAWDIHFENAVLSDDNNVEPTSPIVLDEKYTSLEYGVALDTPGDVFAFDVDIVNAGTIDAMISSIYNYGLTESEKEFLNYTVTYEDGSEIGTKDLLRAGERKKIHIEIEYKNAAVIEKGDLLYMNLSYDINYIQADETAILRDF